MTPQEQNTPCFYHGTACEIPVGLCHCQCGRRTNIIQQTQRSDGHIKGQPYQYLSGHNKRTGRRASSRIVTIEGVEYQTIPLTRGMEAIVDFADYERLAQHLWYAQKADTRSGFYAARTENRDDGKVTISMHREVLGMAPGRRAQNPDHIDGNGLHNWRSNLRPAATSENAWNSLGHSRNTSGFRGVTRKRNKWQASVMAKGVLVLRKAFATKVEAAKAVDEAVKKHHGVFARLNFPEPAA